MQSRNPGWTRHVSSWAMLLLIFGLVLACYWPALRGSILWDDPAHITRPDLRSWDGLVRIWTEMRVTQQYYPVLFTAFWVEHRLWGDSTLGYHLINVALHAGSSCLLAFLLRRLWVNAARSATQRGAVVRHIPRGVEWLAALVFAVHPVCVESVAWMTEQKNTLSLLFYLLAALAYLQFIEHRRWTTYGLATGLFLLALGSKTVTVTLPAAILVVIWWMHGRVAWRRDVLPLIPWFVVALGLGLFIAWFEREQIGADGADFALSFSNRVLLSARGTWFYLGKVLWPAELSFFYRRWDVPVEAGGWIGYLAAAVAVTVGFWVIRKRFPGLLACWLLFVGSLFPVLGFFNGFFSLFSHVADHLQYLAILAPIAAVAGGFGVVLLQLSKWQRIVAAASSVALILVLAVLTNRQSALYRDNETLFRATITRTPSSWMAHHILANTLSKTDYGHQEAIAEYREVLRLKPDYPDAYCGLGMELARTASGKAEAIAAYERAIELRPAYAEAHNNLGVELGRLPGREEDAIAHLEAALQAKPRFPEAHANLADLLVKSPRRLPEAIAHYTKALDLNPRLAWVHCRLAFQLAPLPGRHEEAVAHYRQALAIEPNSIDAHNGLAIAYVINRDFAAARREWESVLRIDPRQTAARNNLARLMELDPH